MRPWVATALTSIAADSVAASRVAAAMANLAEPAVAAGATQVL